MPNLAVVVTTWAPRGEDGWRIHETAKDVMHKAAVKLYGVDLWFHVADDGSQYPRHVERMLVSGRRLYNEHATATITDRLGCGGALNAGLRYVFDNDIADIVLYLQGDWTIDAPLDLAPSLALLSSGTADIVRLGPTHPGLTGHVERTMIPGAEWCLEYDWKGGGYVVGWRPALYHRRVFDRFPLDGLDGLSACEAERIWLERMAAGPNPPRVFHAPNTTLAGPFRHIETIELGDDDPATLTERYRNG